MGWILGYGARLQVTLWVGAAACGSVCVLVPQAGRGAGSGRQVIQWLGGSRGAAAGGFLGVRVT